MNKPLISIVTVSYNAVTTIEQTILSVINQTYPQIEYIIIDGGSTDGTIDIIKKYEDKITYWISEPDKGIYDAMNKGIKIAIGEWINFMNSGDSFYSDRVLYDIFMNKLYDVDVIYGDTCIIETWGKYERIPRPMSDMPNKIPFCHQSAFVKTHLMRKYLFDVRFKVCADHNFFYILWKNNHVFLYLTLSIANYNRSIDSYSGDNELLACREKILISNPINPLFVLLKSYTRHYIARLFNQILPYSLIIKKRKIEIKRMNNTKSISWE